MPIICPNCGNEVSDNTFFCPECGIKIDSLKKDNMLNNTPSTIHPSLTTIAIIGICILFFIMCLALVPTKTISTSIEVAYTDNETYYEKEPFDTQESYQEQVPYQTTEIYTDTVPVPISVPYQDYEYSYQTHNAGTGMYYSSIPTGCVCSSTRYMYDKDGVYGSLCVQLTCQISTPVTKYRTEMQQQSIQKERPVTKYRTETKTRTITQYHDVAKTRDVMRTRIEQRPLEVNWLMEFKTPYSFHLPIISGQ